MKKRSFSPSLSAKEPGKKRSRSRQSGGLKSSSPSNPVAAADSSKKVVKKEVIHDISKYLINAPDSFTNEQLEYKMLQIAKVDSAKDVKFIKVAQTKFYEAARPAAMIQKLNGSAKRQGRPHSSDLKISLLMVGSPSNPPEVNLNEVYKAIQRTGSAKETDPIHVWLRRNYNMGYPSPCISGNEDFNNKLVTENSFPQTKIDLKGKKYLMFPDNMAQAVEYCFNVKEFTYIKIIRRGEDDSSRSKEILAIDLVPVTDCGMDFFKTGVCYPRYKGGDTNVYLIPNRLKTRWTVFINPQYYVQEQLAHRRGEQSLWMSSPSNIKILDLNHVFEQDWQPSLTVVTPSGFITPLSNIPSPYLKELDSSPYHRESSIMSIQAILN